MAKAKAKATRGKKGRGLGKVVVGSGWIDRAEEKNFWKPDPGKHTVRVIGDVVEREASQFKRTVYDIPTEKGTLTTSSWSLITPLAAYAKRHGKHTKGAMLTFRVKGEGIARRFSEVAVR